MSQQPKLSKTERAELKRLSKMFPQIVEHSNTMGSFDYYVLSQLLDAERDNAPTNSCYKNINNQWVLSYPKLSTGQIVKIYQDPISRVKLEGEAELIDYIDTHGTCERWSVRFGKDSCTYERSIMVNQ